MFFNILKSFSADIPADFTGGIVDIETKSFPDEPFFSYSLGSNFNFNSSFNNNYLTYQGSKNDFLGFDGGLRSLPVSRTDQSLPVDIITNYDNMLEINNLFSKNLSVIELVALGRQPYTNWVGNLSKNDKSIINKALQQTNIENLKDKKCFELSDGQLQKVMISRALAQDTNLIILDEPTTHLDMYHKAYVLKLLQNCP